MSQYDYPFESFCDASPILKKILRLFDMSDGPHPEKVGKQHMIAKALTTMKSFDANRVLYPISL